MSLPRNRGGGHGAHAPNLLPLIRLQRLMELADCFINRPDRFHFVPLEITGGPGKLLCRLAGQVYLRASVQPVPAPRGKRVGDPHPPWFPPTASVHAGGGKPAPCAWHVQLGLQPHCPGSVCPAAPDRQSNPESCGGRTRRQSG